MVGNCCAVVVGDGETAFLINEVADERSIKYKTLRPNLVASHAFGEGGDFGGGEGGVPDADFGCTKRRKIISPVAPVDLWHNGVGYPKSKCVPVYNRR